jgi:uncharacterized peroxidase-related enzyme
MPFVKSLPEDAGPPEIFKTYPKIYKAWSEMSQELMNGPSELTPGERELLLAFAAGTAGCEFVYVAHSEVAYAWGIERGFLETLVKDSNLDSADQRLRPLLMCVRKLTLTPGNMTQADVDAILSAGWNEKTIHDVIAVTARMCFMQRLVEGFGFKPFSKGFAQEHAARRVKLGYVQLYPVFAERPS